MNKRKSPKSTPTKPYEPTPTKPYEPTPTKPYEPTPTKPYEPTNMNPDKDYGCKIDIKIENKGEINIYNCSEPCPSFEDDGPKDDHFCPPVAPGACVPVSLGSKPKQSRRFKLDKLLKNIQVPSTLGASFFHMAHRYTAGKTAANQLEQRVFNRLRGLSPELQRLLACTSDSFDSLSDDERNRLFNPDLLSNIDQPIDIAQLSQAFIQEVASIAGVNVFDSMSCSTEERPGKVRTPPHPGGEFPPPPVRICRVNGLRTGQFLPQLSEGDYTPDEIQQVCHVVLDGTEPKQVCEVQHPPCPVPQLQIGNACLRVQEIKAGDALVLEGINFSSIETKVRLYDTISGNMAREVDANVCGDEETPLTEVVNGTQVPILDCRVHDRLTFRVPDDLPLGPYNVVVAVPNVNNVPVWGDYLESERIFIEVVLPPTARFQISSEQLNCRRETAPMSWGSDEVGIKIFSIPIFSDLTIGETQEPNDGKPIRRGDVDTGEHRPIDYLLFSHQQPIIGLAIGIRGYEVDGEDAFEKEIEDWQDAFVEILKVEIDFLKSYWGLIPAGGIGYLLGSLGLLTTAIAVAIAAAIILAIDLFIALWAPADLIIEDTIGPIVLDLARLTNVNVPKPLPSKYTSPQGIKVEVHPLEKIAHQYREMRRYINEDEDSVYEIELRYNRVA